MSSRRIASAAVAVAAIAVAGALIGVRTQDAGAGPDRASASGASAKEVPFNFYADAYGLRIGTSPRFDEDRELTGGSIAIAGSRDDDDDVTFYSEENEDTDRPPDPFPLPARRRVLAEATLSPGCGSNEALPVLTLTSRSDPEADHVDTYRPNNPDEFRAALETYCSLGPDVVVTGSTQEPDGAFSVRLQVLNPTREPVEVASEELRDADTIWQPASTTVPPGSTGDLVLRGQGEGCSATTPWATGRLRIDGVVFKLEEGASEQC